uniref:(northern house mosquito) hypothetical protein n=1 Tax=Culex pipiens TaxID=7175 RepID=A0A8D8I2F7_CULPI
MLDELKYFKAAENNGFDPMHDILEGVAHQILKLVLRCFTKQKKYFQIELFNKCLGKFDYGCIESRDKPNQNFTVKKLAEKGNKFKQTAAQTWVLLRVFPFIVYDCGHIPEGDPHMKLIILLQVITYLAFSNILNDEMVEKMKESVHDLQKTFKQCFPTVTPINKFHHLSHYSYNVKITSVTNGFSCMRFEAMNKLPKGQMRNGQNYQNVPFSLAKRQNLKQVAAVINRNYYQRVDIITEKIVPRNEMPHANLLQLFPSRVCLVKRLKIDGVHFRENVAIKYDDNLRNTKSFAQIRFIYYVDEKFYFVAEHLNMVCFDEKYNSYRLEKNDEIILIPEENVYKRKTYNLWVIGGSKNVFISPQYYDEFK